VKLTKSKKILILLEITSLILIFPIATSAHALNSGNTGLTFVINPYVGGLAITVPSSATFTPIDTPETATVVTLTLGAVTVTDTRRALGGLGSWTTFAAATNLYSDTDTLTANTFSYASGIPAISGGAVTVTAQSRSSLATTTSVEAGSAVTGNHIVTWTPTLTIPVPALKTPGSYTGIITHSVS
jgi:hypothetical protein